VEKQLGNRIGVILHRDWEEFSPLMYSHYGAGSRVFQLQNFLIEYRQNHQLPNNDGHLYNPCHMMVGFLQSIDKDIHTRVKGLDDHQVQNLQKIHEYPNAFDGGCWIVNVSPDNFGETVEGDGFTCQGNIVGNELIADTEDWS
jgi:hypothetical protein